MGGLKHRGRIVEEFPPCHDFEVRAKPARLPPPVAGPPWQPYTRAVPTPPPSTIASAAPALTGRALEPAPSGPDDAPWTGWLRSAGLDSDASAAHFPASTTEFFWETPEGEALYAAGEAARLEVDGIGRFSEARSWMRSILSTARIDGGAIDEGLVAFARFAFENEAAPGTTSAAGVLVVPSRLVVRRPDEPDRFFEWTPVGAESTRTHRSGNGTGLPSRAAASRREDTARDEWSREGWNRAVADVLARIACGDLEKVVLARARHLRGARAWDPDALFLGLRRDYPGCYRFLYKDPLGGILVGASPERLVSLRGARVRTDAVAGTSRIDGRGAAETERALLADAKELREHAVVAREIAAALREAGATMEPCPAPSIFLLKRLAHLRAQLTAMAPPGLGILDLVEGLHPTPAVAGTPRAAAIEKIGRLEPRRRGWYAGPIGWMSAAGDGDFTVGLRTAWVHGDRALLYAGAGIVAGSDPEREWDECESKMDAIQEALERGAST